MLQTLNNKLAAIVFPGDMPNAWDASSLQDVLSETRASFPHIFHDLGTPDGESELQSLILSAKKRLENVRYWVKKNFKERIHIDDHLQSDATWEETWRGIFCKLQLYLF